MREFTAGVPVNRGGRPRTLEQKSSVSTWIPARIHDRLIAVANKREMSVSAYVSQVLILMLNEESSGPLQ